jgi:hypothetical protein
VAKEASSQLTTKIDTFLHSDFVLCLRCNSNTGSKAIHFLELSHLVSYFGAFFESLTQITDHEGLENSCLLALLANHLNRPLILQDLVRQGIDLRRLPVNGCPNGFLSPHNIPLGGKVFSSENSK